MIQSGYCISAKISYDKYSAEFKAKQITPSRRSRQQQVAGNVQTSVNLTLETPNRIIPKKLAVVTVYGREYKILKWSNEPLNQLQNLGGAKDISKITILELE